MLGSKKKKTSRNSMSVISNDSIAIDNCNGLFDGLDFGSNGSDSAKLRVSSKSSIAMAIGNNKGFKYSYTYLKSQLDIPLSISYHNELPSRIPQDFGLNIGERPLPITDNDDVVMIYKPAGYECDSNRASTNPQTYQMSKFTRTFFFDENDGGCSDIPVGRGDSNELGLVIDRHPRCGLGMAHRLDKMTSGLLVCYKNKRGRLMATECRDNWTKNYIAIVTDPFNRLDNNVKYQCYEKLNTDQTPVRVCPNGKQCCTTFESKSSFSLGSLKCCILVIRLKGGLTHQIRVHMAHLGHPILNDKLYSGPMHKSDIALQSLSKTRHCLHCTHMSINNDHYKFSLEGTCPLPYDLVSILRNGVGWSHTREIDNIINLGRTHCYDPVDTLRRVSTVYNTLHIVTGGCRFTDVHNHLCSIADCVINCMHINDPSHSDLKQTCGLMDVCYIRVMKNIGNLLKDINYPAYNLIYVHCKSGCHRAPAVARYISSSCNRSHMVTHITLGDATRSKVCRNETCVKDAVTHSRKFAYIYGIQYQGEKNAVKPYIAANCNGVSETLVRNKYCVELSKYNYTFSLPPSPPDVDLLPVTFDYDYRVGEIDDETILACARIDRSTVDPDRFTHKALIDVQDNLQICSNERIKQDAYVTVAGDECSQMRHLLYFNRNDDNDESCFSFFFPYVERAISRLKLPESMSLPDEFPVEYLKLDKAAGQIFRELSPEYLKKGDCIDSIIDLADRKIKLINEGKRVDPSPQSLSGRGKRIRRDKYESDVYAATGRMIRVSSGEDHLICLLFYPEIHKRVVDCPDFNIGKNPFALGYHNFLKGLGVITGSGNEWKFVDHCQVYGPDMKKMDASLQRSLISIVIKRLLRPFLKGPSRWGSVSKIIEFVIKVHCASVTKLPGGKHMYIDTGASSGSLFVSLIESIIMSAVDLKTRDDFYSKYPYASLHVCLPDFHESMGDDNIRSLLSLNPYATDVVDVMGKWLNRYSKIYISVVSGINLTCHDPKKSGKGAVGDIFNLEYLGVSVFSPFVAMRSIDAALGSVISPEVVSSGYSHLFLRCVGVLSTCPIGPAAEVLLNLIKYSYAQLKDVAIDSIRSGDLSALRADNSSSYSVDRLISCVDESKFAKMLSEGDPNCILQFMLRMYLHPSGGYGILEGIDWTRLFSNNVGISTKSSYMSSKSCSCWNDMYVNRIVSLGCPPSLTTNLLRTND